jgi:hypothetical protein
MNTRGSAVVLGVAAVALLAHFSTALGAGKITGLTLNLPAVKTCTLETITVTGTGRCSTFTVQLGDSTAPVHVPGDFPILVYHAYSKQGTYTPTAQGQGNCSGTDSALLQVVGPSINSMFHVGITPGAGVIFQGENFGYLPGFVMMHYTDYGGQAIDLGRHLRGRNYSSRQLGGRSAGDVYGRRPMRCRQQCVDGQFHRDTRL